MVSKLRDIVLTRIRRWFAEDPYASGIAGADEEMTTYREVYVAVRNGRKAVGVELKPRYFKQAVRNLKSLKFRQRQSLVEA